MTKEITKKYIDDLAQQALDCVNSYLLDVTDEGFEACPEADYCRDSLLERLEYSQPLIPFELRFHIKQLEELQRGHVDHGDGENKDLFDTIEILKKLTKILEQPPE